MTKRWWYSLTRCPNLLVVTFNLNQISLTIVGFIRCFSIAQNCNTVQNLARQGKTFDFGFLWNRAGYDIPFHINFGAGIEALR